MLKQPHAIRAAGQERCGHMMSCDRQCGMQKLSTDWVPSTICIILALLIWTACCVRDHRHHSIDP